MESLVKAVKDAYAAKQAADDVYTKACTDYPSCSNPIRETAEERLYDASVTLARECEALAFYVCRI